MGRQAFQNDFKKKKEKKRKKEKKSKGHDLSGKQPCPSQHLGFGIKE